MNLPGKGIATGMVQTAKNFLGSYVSKERMVTVQYPEERDKAHEAARSFPFLVFDQDPEAGLRCVACKICEKECPPQCIYIVMQRDENGKPTKQPETFDIDVSVCMSCQICVEVCPFEAIKMDTEYEHSEFDRFDGLLRGKDRLAKSNDYYHSIHPTEAAEVDERLDKERKAKEAADKAKAAKLAALANKAANAEKIAKDAAAAKGKGE